MKRPRLETMAAVLPYAAWMALMAALPSRADFYALRSLAVLALLVASVAMFRKGRAGSLAALDGMAGRSFGARLADFAVGIAAGAVVFVLWIAPETFFASGQSFVPGEPSPYDPGICGWTLTLARLAGSSFVIAPAEELFFRGFLYRWLVNDSDWTKADPRKFNPSAFLWVVALFALEHNTRLAQGAVAGAFYGFLAVRRGLVSAMVAHAATNLLLAFYVIHAGAWRFW